jgi:nucleotide-binding universal stress UspA family protein
MKILIATDGSEFSTLAVEECCRLMPNLGASQIKILSVFEAEYGLGAEPFAISAEYIQAIADAAEQKAKHFCASAADLIREKLHDGDLDLTVETMAGPPGKEIVDFAETWGADLIVVGCHGRGFWGRMIGSVSDVVVHHAPCSVMIVRKAK